MLKVVSWTDYGKYIESIYNFETLLGGYIDKSLYFYTNCAKNICIIRKDKKLSDNYEVVFNSGTNIETRTIEDDIRDVLKEYTDGTYIYDWKTKQVIDIFGDVVINSNFSASPPREIKRDEENIVKVLAKYTDENKKVHYFNYTADSGFSLAKAFLVLGSFSFCSPGDKSISESTVRILLKLTAKKMGFNIPTYFNMDATVRKMVEPSIYKRTPKVVHTSGLDNFLKKRIDEVVEVIQNSGDQYIDEVLQKLAANENLKDGKVTIPYTLLEVKSCEIKNGILEFNTTLDEDSISVLFGISVDDFEVVEEL